MKRTLAISALQLCTAACMLGQMAGMATPDPGAIPVTKASNVTFTKDVAPIVQQHCQSCHRPGEGTPFSMLTYEEARPWAIAMKRMVVTRAMPPWFEDGHTEKFENNRSLTQAQIDTIAAWVDAGAPKGDPKDMPPALDFVKGWTIPKPDKIYQLPRAILRPCDGNPRLPVRDSAHRLYKRYVGAGCRGRTDGPFGRTPYRCLCSYAGIELLQGSA